MKTDIVIIGAGPVGLSFAKSLANTDIDITIIEKQTAEKLANPANDGREIAHTHSSVNTLKKLGFWDRINSGDIAPIKEATVLDGHSPYALHFDHKHVCDEALGYLIPNHLIRKAAYEEVIGLDSVKLLTNVSVSSSYSNREQASVTLDNGTKIQCKLIVSADSRFSETRRNMGISASIQDYGRTAIVCRMQHEKSHQQTAFECFHYGITMALLPMPGKLSSVVITVEANRSEAMLNMPEADFNAMVEKELNSQLGSMQLTGQRYHYPLVGVYADKFVDTRYALIGDAAVGMHPVTAHGFNLGLKSQDILAELITTARARNQDIAAMGLLELYQSKYRRISKPLYMGTNAIVKLFTSETPTLKLARQAVLRFGNTFKPVKKQIMSQLTEVD